MSERTYWTGRRIGRRAALRGAGVGIAGLAGAALIGCGGDEETATPAATAAGGGAAPTAATGVEGKVPADQVRVTPGFYDGVAPPSAAEMNPQANARYGGTLAGRYLDPPHMDFNRTLSCTVNSSMDYAKNKLTRAQFGPLASQTLVEIEPDLAESWEVNADATQFTFHLHQGVKFQNVEPTFGRELTSEDVRLSVERYQAGGVQKDQWTPVVQMETPDDYTIVFQLDQPLSDFPRNIAAWSHMDAKEMLEDPDFLKEHAVGTGPFIQEEWTQKERAVWGRNPEYFEEGLPYLDRIITPVQNDTAVTRAGYQTDNFFYWSARDEDDAQGMMNSTGDSVYLKRPRAQGLNTDAFHFQMENPKWQDERVRRAFSLVLDRAEWDLARQGDDHHDGYSISPIAWPFLHDSIPNRESQGPWYQYDVAEGRRLLQAAGYSESNPIKADAPVWYWRTVYQEIMQPMYALIPELEFEVRVVDNPTAVQMLNDRNYDDTMNVTWGPPAYSVDQMVFPWYHSNGGLNHANVNDPEMDKLLEAQRAEQDFEASKEIWQQIEDRIYDQVWQVLFPTAMTARRLWHNYVLNWRPHGIASFTCYGNGMARSMWLDEGAPGT